MNKKALLFGFLYAISVIVFKLIILLGGYTLTKFGFYYSNIVAVFMILPFFFLAVYLVREKDYGGVIGGKEAVRICMTILAVSIVLISAYNYVEFDWKFREIAIQYYNSNEYLDLLKEQQAKQPGKIKTEDFPKIISEQIADLSAFKSTTGKLMPMLFIGLSSAFITAVLLKRNKKA